MAANGFCIFAPAVYTARVLFKTVEVWRGLGTLAETQQSFMKPNPNSHYPARKKYFSLRLSAVRLLSSNQIAHPEY